MKFSASQVTTMVVALCAAAVLAPVGAIAASSAVTLVDGDRPGWEASVDSAGRLAVGDGGSGQSITVDSGSGSLAVGGTVVAADPTKTWSRAALEQALPLQDLVVPLVGPTKLPIRVSTVSAYLRSGEDPIEVQIVRKEIPNSYNGACTSPEAPGAALVIHTALVRTDAPIQETFGTPLRVSSTAGLRSCVYLRFVTNDLENYPIFDANVSGYYE